MGTLQDSAKRRLAVAMIVRDEAAVLAETIDSIREVADDLFVLDTGSTDDTIRIAESSGARVATVPWTDDFSAARNSALDQLDSEWVLWLDAGEQLTEESQSALRQFVDSEADPDRVYMLMVVVPTADGSSSPEQAAQMRLMPNRPELRFEGRVRETLEPAIERQDLIIEMAPGRIDRHRRDLDPTRKTAKAQRDIRLVTLECSDTLEPPVRLLLAVGEACSNLGEVEKARQMYSQAVRQAERGSTDMLDAYYGLLTTYDADPSLCDEQLSAGLEALEVYPLDAQLLCAMGSYLQNQGRLDLAERAFETAVLHGQVDLETWHLSEIAEMAVVCLALTQQLAQKPDQARTVLLDALDRFPESDRVRRHLVDLLVKLGRSQEALGFIGPLAGTMGTAEPWRNAVLGACKGAQKDWLGALGYLQSAYVGGCRDPFCLRWLVVTLISSGQLDAARPVLNEWLAREPANAEALAYFERMEEASADEDDRRLRLDAGNAAGQTVTPVLPSIDTTTTGAAEAEA